MSRVLKYTLHDHGEGSLALPLGAQILSVGDQGGALQLWALALEGRPAQERQFAVLFTGFDSFPYRGHFIGTVLSSGGSIVRHVFEILEEA